ncbi:rod shape-determining protein [Streptomyces caniscabiei]|uniref:hypothetical protein n=1 Tax=Streptomyces caniscabiei TaxID=2746961 RepID=UPI0029AF677B|nr:hypothetical protein [Streptomyces caniscabiei]MDX2600145.1 rod shape-determining protein [Streptomyces caniscabiei]MDX2734562.1 rod shape-determining protein [Streptomyces caniscabiei]MDX2778436.1 rod shape-determining protein [Streptomyces caniscabiei]
MTGAPDPHTVEDRHRHRPWPGCPLCWGLALDLGSARTRAWTSGRGGVVDVPSAPRRDAEATHPAGPGTSVGPGTRVGPPGSAGTLRQLLGPDLPRSTRPLIIVTAPVLDGLAHRTRARAAVDVLRPLGVLTVSSARSIAVAADADLAGPLLVVDIGAQFTEVVLLCEGAVADARRATLGIGIGTGDPEGTAAPGRIAEAVSSMLTAMLREDHTSLTVDALHRGVLLAGGGALHPEIPRHLTGPLPTPPKVVPSPHTAAVRGAATLLRSAHTHPASTPTPSLPVGRPRLGRSGNSGRG